MKSQTASTTTIHGYLVDLYEVRPGGVLSNYRISVERKRERHPLFDITPREAVSENRIRSAAYEGLVHVPQENKAEIADWVIKTIKAFKQNASSQ